MASQTLTAARILGTSLTAQPYESAIDRLLAAGAAGSRIRAHFCTVHSVVAATRDAALRNVFDSAQMLAMDGMPLVWVAKRRGAVQAERVCGPDVMLSMCDRGRPYRMRHFFLGGQAGVPVMLAARLVGLYPGLEVVGAVSPPFRSLSAEEDAALIDQINAAAPTVLWIGLGSPKQEIWAAEHQSRLSSPLILPVGAAFDFHSGRIKRAPAWLQRIGLEWLFRLAADPRRLWRRYAVTNARFVYLLLLEEISRRIRSSSADERRDRPQG